MLLSILIPTYNRSKQLIQNLGQLIQYVTDIGGWNDIEIVCSDNNSIPKHKDAIISFDQIYNDKVKFYYQIENIGFEKNLLFLLQNCNGIFVMLLGDDDYISHDYLALIIRYLKTNKYGAIFPNCYSVDESGEPVADIRDAIMVDRHLEKRKDISLVVKAHQLSGLVFRKEGTYESYSKNVKSNLYPQIYFMGYNLLKEDGVHITRYPVMNTVIEKKNFEYHWDNLFGEIAKSVDAIKLGVNEKTILIKYVINYNFERIYNRYSVLHPHVFVKQVVFGYDISFLFKKLLLYGFIKSYPVFIKQFFGKAIHKIAFGKP